MDAPLLKERERATFNVTELIHLLNGSEEETKRRKELESWLYNNPVFRQDDRYQISREEVYERGLQKTRELVNLCRRKNIKFDSLDFARLNISTLEELPFFLHVIMFIPTIRGQGTEEQKRKWLPLAEDLKILGTYAQTELGHGTFLRGLETKATYDVSSREFIVNSPTITSMKWWPGGLGKTCNYAVIAAQLYTKGKCYGIHMFIVQLRSLEDHKPLPGVTIGDIGNKYGFHTVDNGFLRLDNVRIPYENMLMRYAKACDYIPPVNPKINYGTMTSIRVDLVKDASVILAAASTIAIRYSAVRHQTEIRPGEEPPVLDYITQQFKLFPQIATAIAFHFAGDYMHRIYDKVQSEIFDGHLSAITELHGISAGLKAFTTDTSIAGVEICRRACGGHGYSNASGFQRFYENWLGSATYEGENTVMYLQAARYLFKCYDNPKEAPETMSYLRYPQNKMEWNVKSADDVSNYATLITAFEQRALSKISSTAKKLKNLTHYGMNRNDAWNAASVDILHSIKAHCHYFIVKNYMQSLNHLKMSSPLRQVMTAVALLYANYGIDEHAGDFLESGFMNGKQINLVRAKILQLLKEIRVNAVAIVDSFDFDDRFLRSALGAYDGNVYNRLFKWAKLSPLNKTEVHSSYKYLRRILQSKL
ncbi:uncharacterized protein TRIADDRAFT_27529 [Trichoplax adhaerens]|uniref:Acyl-coenzyme A oxidase n=1 Tax=Trichoplax adhaerens TaxID=10228 RepID=B3S2B4_TRIAD|nr:hypothetical protein TRIADDRAFT_27529 [Trichoplax adhaerens]EDV23301.1 hypothetical protein TRIADDRAFT_27529 [Trichoplax adhaerens]|eukprot:XP_002114211.1 hypothetical protein TRIADDRAFT_27529 [Trichoplax adhaerens]